MKLPFTTEQFLKVFETYNSAVWPFQVFFHIIALLAILSALKSKAFSNKVITLVIGSLWIWMGLVYHLIYFTAINKAAYIFGIMFIAEGILFLYAGFYKKNISFQFQFDVYGIAGMLFIVFALVVYPVLGYIQGHVYPAAPSFGVPCPTTIFTLGILLWTNKKIPFVVLIIPLIWSVIGTSAAFYLGMKEDIGLLIAGMLFMILAIFRNKSLLKASLHSQHG